MSDNIVARSISHSFAGRQVLNGVTFQVQSGEIFGLLGPSGAGKTTLIKILTGQLWQDKGYAAVLGKDTRKLSEAEHRRIGAMMDTFGLYERLSVYDNLSFYADIYRVSRSGINGILKEIGLYEGQRTPVMKLSKGMKNRLSLARALMGNASILFLDEPTAGLDPVTTREIHNVLAKQKEKGTTVFLTTHNMFEAESLCDNVALLSKGRIMEYGRPADICKRYDHLNKIRVTLKNGEMIMLKNDTSSATLIKEYMEKNEVESIHSTEPALETVFIELTGKGLG